MAKLMVTRSGTNLGSWFIEEKRLVIGRAEGVDIRLEDAAVSKQHASIEVMGVDHILLDLESSNGTFVNGTRVTRHLLRHGDAIDILGFELKYVDHKSVVSADGDRTMIFTRVAEGTLMPAGGGTHAGAGAGKAPLAEARTLELSLPVAVLKGVNGPRAGGTIAIDRSLIGVGERGRDYAAVFRRPDGFAVARVSGKPPKVDGKPIADGWHGLRDGAVIEVGGEKVELAYIAKR
jgi:hypothetical protein